MGKDLSPRGEVKILIGMALVGFLVAAGMTVAHSSSPGSITATLPPTYSHPATYVAPLPDRDGIYKFCDSGNLVYEMFSTKKNEYGAITSSMQINFNDSQCTTALNTVSK